MNIAIMSPRVHTLQHRVRGSGFYIENLKNALLKYDKKNNYIFSDEGKGLSSDVDLIHYPYFEPFFLTLPIFSSIGRSAFGGKKRKTVVTVHDLIPLVFPKYFPRGLRGNLKWQIQKMALKGSGAIITDSQSSKTDILKFVGVRKDKVHAVYLAAGEQFKRLKTEDLGTKNNELRTKYKIPEKFVLYVGDVTWNKNLPRLVEAIKKINIPLVLVGKALVQTGFDRSNPWNQDLDKVQKLTESDGLFIRLGFVDNKDLVSLYNLATLFVMPSLYEGFGLPVLEAMSCGCPVVTSKEGSLAEVAEDAVHYIDPYDINSIANGIGEIYFNTDVAKELSQKGLTQVKKFSWEKTAKETIKVYESV